MEPSRGSQPCKLANSKVVSVCPYPSISGRPVLWVNRRKISGCSCSPAVAACRRVGMGGMPFFTRYRYTVGGAQKEVTPYWLMIPTSRLGSKLSKSKTITALPMSHWP